LLLERYFLNGGSMMTHTCWLKSAIAMAAIGLAGMAIAQTASTGSAQSYPTKTVRFVITFPPGGGSDFTVRPIAQKLSETWGQSVIVESRPGGSAMIGTDYVVKSPPDGYTVLLSGSSEVSMNVALFKKMPYDPVRDLQPVMLVCTAPLLLVAHPSLPVKSVKELVALARSKPGALSYATIGAGSPHHFAGELMNTTFRIQMTQVPYKGGAPAMMDNIGGYVPIGFSTASIATPHVKAGRLRALAVTSGKRSSAIPDVPTVAEGGAPGFDILQWFAIWLPAKTPKDIAGKLHGEVVRIVQSPEYKQRQLEVAADVIGSSPEALASYQKTEIEKYRKIAASAGITLE
jgi:tripartite-type tricarboxylate transporter receptor subunit TctC